MKFAMKSPLFILRVLFVFAFILVGSNGFSQTIWDGPYMTFTKENNANWTLEENQDHITDNVWITRRNSQGIYNIAAENFYLTNVSPQGTEWAFGNTDEIAGLTFSDWRTAINMNPPEMIDQAMVVHLIEADIYIDIFFVSWQQNSGGGFSYKRRTDSTVGILEKVKSESVLVFPNPTSHALHLSVQRGMVDYKILNHLGQNIQEGQWNTVYPLDVANLSPGLYVLKFGEFSSRWLKKE